MNDFSLRDRWIAGFLFFGFFGLYLFTAGPWVVPYRDAGEMSTLLATLGVAHPPGYPLYTLVGHLLMSMPFGNLAYRANLFSGLAGAAALALLFVLLRTWFPKAASMVAAVFLGLSHPFWELSVVSEMYTLGALMLIAVCLAATRGEDTLLLPFLLGLALGVRMDLLLLIPLFVAWRLIRKTPTNWILFGALFALGVSVFLYLPIRSRTDPILDWGNPESLRTLFASMSRKSYGGTLDLISTSYARGENFGVNLSLYFDHLWKSLGAGAVLAFLGLGAVLRKRWKPGLLFGALFFISGPLFFFMANMPPNPHSLAIVEASYLPADIAVTVFAAFALSTFFEAGPVMRAVAVLISVVGLSLSAVFGFARNNKRNNLYARDYAINMFRSLPAHAVGVFHDDVQLFTLWQAQAVEKRRLDVGLLSTGLSGSDWYWDMMKRWSTDLAPRVSLKTPEGWPALVKASGLRPVRFGYDVDWPDPTHVKISGANALASLGDDAYLVRDVGMDPFQFLLRRGVYRYGATSDFFSSDLVGNLARAYDQHGLTLLLQNRSADALPYFMRGAVTDLHFPRPLMNMGYVYFTGGNLAAAESAYQEAVSRAQFQVSQAVKFKALPDSMAGVKSDLSGAYVSLGGTEERLGKKDRAREAYGAAIDANPGNAQAHYNLAVSYWGTDWDRVVEHLTDAVRLNPSNSDAQKYLTAAIQKRGTR